MERSRAKSRRSTRDSVAKKRRELRGGGGGGGGGRGKGPARPAPESLEGACAGANSATRCSLYRIQEALLLASNFVACQNIDPVNRNIKQDD